jgi:Fe-coproporphyrin III synthase
MEAIVVATYRCNAKCYMCNTWQYPTKPEDEIGPDVIRKLPDTVFTNITGGEPFLREDLIDIVSILRKKAKRIVISTNGYFTDRIVEVAKKFPETGFRVSLEGLPAANDELRGLKDGFDHGLRTLLQLRSLGIKDIGFGITVSDRNVKDLMELYELAKNLEMEFATAVTHNSYYFHKFDNSFKDPEMITGEFDKLTCALLKSKKPKDWFRAYFNYGLTNYIRGNKRLLPCEVGSDMFMLDPFGEIKPCNGLDASMGNLKEKPFEEIWTSKEAEEVRCKVKNCDKNCWMIGSVSPAMKKRIAEPLKWVIRKKMNIK